MVGEIDGAAGRKVHLEGKEYLYFGGTSYLGVTSSKAFTELLVSNVRKYGSNLGTSRHSNLRQQLYSKAESALAAWVGSPACLTLSSGYLAGQLLNSHFRQQPYRIFLAPQSHSALHHPELQCYNSWEALKKELLAALSADKGKIPVLCLDSVNFNGKGYPDFTVLQSLPLEDIILVVDDSHAIGVFGVTGQGSYSNLALKNPRELIVVASLGKALGLQAGAIWGTEERLEELKETPLFYGASPPAPAYLASWMKAGEFYEHQRRQLSRNLDQFHKCINAATMFSYIEGHPVFSYSDPSLSRFLFQNGILVTDFKYPAAATAGSGRLVLNAAHQPEDIKQLCTLLTKYFESSSRR